MVGNSELDPSIGSAGGVVKRKERKGVGARPKQDRNSKIQLQMEPPDFFYSNCS